MSNIFEPRIERLTSEDLLGPLNNGEKKNAPPFLYVSGDCDILKTGPRVSIIGSRKPSKKGVKKTQILTKRLVKEGIVIVSGLAAGIDTIAHRTAIEQGGKTIAVLGTPLNKCYPEENRDLQKEIMKNHLAISQFSPQNPIKKKNFPLRNRTMALISHVSVIVEGGISSGTQHQGWEAIRLGRPLFIFKPLIDNKSLEWPKKMTDYGAITFSLRQISELLEVLPASGARVGLNVAP